MSADKTLGVPQILRCYLTKMSVTAGNMPKPGTDFQVAIATSVRIDDVPEETNTKMMTLDIEVTNEIHGFYEMEAQAQAIVLYPDGIEDSHEIESMNVAGIQEMVSAVRIMLDGATTHFKHGAIRIPNINLAESIAAE